MIFQHRTVAGLHVVLTAPRRPGRVPLVLLHGAGGSARQWRWVMTALPPWIAPIALDLPGHGRSGGRTPDSVTAAADSVARALAALGVRSPVAVAAHSLGGLVGLTLAGGVVPVSALALVCSAPQITPHPQLLRALTGDEEGEAFLRGAFGPRVPAARVDVVVDDLRRVRLAPGGDYLGVTVTDLSDRLSQVDAETLVVIADRDPVISPRKSRAMASRISGARSAVLSGGHYLHVERPAALAALLAELLTPSNPGRARVPCPRSEAS
jgi:pimeloyl-ACP methyl ester carboxylesterase